MNSRRYSKFNSSFIISLILFSLLVTLTGGNAFISRAHATNASSNVNILFFDDFSGDLAKWSIFNGTWKIDYGQLSGTGSGIVEPKDGYIYAGDTAWNNYSLSANVFFGESDFILRSTGHWQNEYRITIWPMGSPYSNTYQICKYQNGIGSCPFGSDRFPFPFPVTAPYNVSVQVVNNHIRLSVNDTLIKDVVDPNPLPAGRFGLGVIWSTHNHFDDVFVHEMAGTGKDLSFTSQATYDGWILESSEFSSKGGSINSTLATFRVGDEIGNKQYRSILSFNTGGLPDNAVITKATLKIRMQGFQGTNPFTSLGLLRVHIRKPFFGTLVGLEPDDFQFAPDLAAAGTFGTTSVNNWYTAVLKSNAYPYLNLTGKTQFRLQFGKDDNNNNLADYMRFFSGNYLTVSARPTLIIEYYEP